MLFYKSKKARVEFFFDWRYAFLGVFWYYKDYPSRGVRVWDFFICPIPFCMVSAAVIRDLDI